MEDKSIISTLVETNDVRIENSENRPRVEMWVDEDAAWIAWHKAQDLGAEPIIHLGVGWL